MPCSKGSGYLSRNQLERLWRTRFLDKHTHEGKDAKNTIYSGKTELKSAFHILGLSKDSWKWLIMKAENPKTGKIMFFVDKCLPFGASFSCSHFQRFSNVLCHIAEYRLQTRKRITHYLDDFLFIARTLFLCNHMISGFLQLCDQIGVPVSMEKIEWALDITVFLGMLLDGRNLILAVPDEKHS